jgi:hypothetical protein
MPFLQPGYVALACRLPRVAGLGEGDLPAKESAPADQTEGFIKQALRKPGASNGVDESIVLGIIDL